VMDSIFSILVSIQVSDAHFLCRRTSRWCKWHCSGFVRRPVHSKLWPRTTQTAHVATRSYVLGLNRRRQYLRQESYFRGWLLQLEQRNHKPTHTHLSLFITDAVWSFTRIKKSLCTRVLEIASPNFINPSLLNLWE
jgi:hypothetical protein